jgi:hypothetical protein
LKRLYEADPPEKLNMGAAGSFLLKAKHILKCQFAAARPPDLPSTWGAVVYEEYAWPPPALDPEEPHQPFHLFLRIERGNFKFVLPIHDGRDPWLVPKFKARARFARFPTSPRFPIGTFLVYRDGLRSASICQWLAVLLMQRSLVTEDEKNVVLEAFFAGKRDDDRSARLLAAERLIRTFLQPTGGWPSFPALYRKTYKSIRVEEMFMSGGGENASYSTTSGAAEEHLTEMGLEGPWDEIGLERYRGRSARHGATRNQDWLIPLKQLRRQQPKLHRALLDRIARGRVRPIQNGGQPYVTIADANEVDLQRERNAELRTPRRFAGKRVDWIVRLSRTGIKRKSAERKLKRWINNLNLSEAEIEASVACGHLARHESDCG